MKSCRLRINDLFYFVTLKKLGKMLTFDYGKENIATKIECPIDDNIFELSIDTYIKLTYFDVAVLYAMQNIYIVTAGIHKFKVISILKYLTGNKNAHFSNDSSKVKTLNESMIFKSIENLKHFQIHSINGKNLKNKKLIQVKIDNGIIEFVCKPAIIEIYKRQLVKCKLLTFPISSLMIKPKNKHYIHQTYEVISFKFYILSQITSTNNFIEFDNEELKELLGIAQKEQKIALRYKKSELSYEYYLKQRRKLKSTYFNDYLIPFLNNLVNQKFVTSYEIDEVLTKIEL